MNQGDYASEVANRSVIQTYQELIEWAEKCKGTTTAGGALGEIQDEHWRGYNRALENLISYLKGRIEELKKDENN